MKPRRLKSPNVGFRGSLRTEIIADDSRAKLSSKWSVEHQSKLVSSERYGANQIVKVMIPNWLNDESS